MSGTAVLIVVASLGVDFGWQPTSDGDLEYIVQIEPELLELIKDGEPIISEIPTDVRGGRRFRIFVGSSDLPRKGTPIRPNNPVVDATPIQEKDDNTAVDRENPLREQGGGALEQQDSPPTKPALPKESASGGGEFNALDPPPLKPNVPFQIGDDAADDAANDADNSFVPNKADKTDQNNNDFSPLPTEPEKPSGTPVPIPDPDAKKIEPKKIHEPDVNAALPLPVGSDPASDAVAFQQAGFSADQATPDTDDQTAQEDAMTSEKPALPAEPSESGSSLSTWFVAMLLFASIGLNFYLGLLARTFYVRYRTIAAQIRDQRVMAA